MRWVLVTDDFPPLGGGVAIWARTVADELHRLGREVLVLTRWREGLGQGLPYEVRGVRGPSFGRHGGMWLGAVGWWRLESTDCVLATTWGVATHLTRICRSWGMPLHVTFHGSDLTRVPRRPQAFARVCEAATFRWVMSDYLGGLLQQRGYSATVLPAPVRAQEEEVYLYPPGRPRRWVMIGRATALKGGDRFVRLVAAAGARGTVVGDGPRLAEWRELADELGADVQFTGHLPHDQVLRSLPDFDLAFLLPRPDVDGRGAEGFGLSLVEAAQAGVATVGCATGGVPEALGPGLVLEDPDDLAASVDAVDRWWHPSRGQVCRRWAAERHGPHRTALALLAATSRVQRG